MRTLRSTLLALLVAGAVYAGEELISTGAAPVNGADITPTSVTTPLAKVDVIDGGVMNLEGQLGIAGPIVSRVGASGRVLSPTVEGAAVGFGPDTECEESGTGLVCTATFVITTGREVHSVQTVAVPDDGAGTVAAGSFQPTGSFATINCQDTNGCNITMDENNAISGTRFCAFMTNTNTVNFADTATVSELAGAFAAGQYDSICMLYVTDRWIEISRSNN